MKAIRGGFAVLICMIFLSLSYAASAEAEVRFRTTEIDGNEVPLSTTNWNMAQR